MKKKSLIVCVGLLLAIIFLYNIFPLSEGRDKLISETSSKIEEADPMSGVEMPVIKEESKDEVLTEDIASQVEANNTTDEDVVINEKPNKKEEEAKQQVSKEEVKKEEVKEEEKPKVEKKSKNDIKIDKIVNIARTKLGKPFRVAGTTDKGYDCSGLIMTSYRKHNVRLPRASYAMARKGYPVSLKNVKKGDLLFFATKPNRPKQISHVGMVTKVQNGKIFFIHSFEKHGVIENTMNEGYYKHRFVKARRIIK